LLAAYALTSGARPQAAHRLLVYHEGSANVRAVQAVENVEVELGERRQRHPARGMHHDVDPAERPLGFVKQTRYLRILRRCLNFASCERSSPWSNS
jgi:hypothetical protein